MFLNLGNANTGMDNLNENLKLADINFKKIGATIAEALNPETTINKVFDIQQQTAKSIRTTMGLTTDVSKELDKLMANVTMNTLEFGIGMEENIKLFTSLNNSMLRNTFLTEVQIENMQAFAKATGISQEEVAKMVVSFDTIGVGIDAALVEMTKIRKAAISYGVNVNTMMKTVAENVKVLNAFNFKNGIEGFTKMVAKAQALRIDFNKTVTLADSLLDPEKAIELAAGMQMLGGSVGDLADPFRILYLAQNDVEGLQDELLKASSSAVLFNEKTGEFDIPRTEMYRLREMAKLTGKSYQELADEAVKSARRTKNLEFLDLTDISEENREMLASLGQIKGGEMSITMPDGTIKSLEEVINSEGDLDVLKDSLQTDKEIALRQMTAVETIAAEIQKTGFFTTQKAIIDQNFIQSIDKVGADFKEGIKGVNDGLENSMATYVDGLTKVVDNLYPDGIFDKAGEVIKVSMDNLERVIESLITEMSDLEQTLLKIKADVPSSANDFISLPSSQRLLSYSEGTVEINNDDLLIGGTNLFNNKNTPNTDNLETFFMKQLDVLKQTTSLVSENKPQVVDVRLSMDGDIDLSLNNLPMNNMSQEVLFALMSNPEFKNKILQIINKTNNFYV